MLNCPEYGHSESSSYSAAPVRNGYTSEPQYIGNPSGTWSSLISIIMQLLNNSCMIFLGNLPHANHCLGNRGERNAALLLKHVHADHWVILKKSDNFFVHPQKIYFKTGALLVQIFAPRLLTVYVAVRCYGLWVNLYFFLNKAILVLSFLSEDSRQSRMLSIGMLDPPE